MARAWLAKDPSFKGGTPGSAPPSNACTDTDLRNVPFWCPPVISYAH